MRKGKYHKGEEGEGALLKGRKEGGKEERRKGGEEGRSEE